MLQNAVLGQSSVADIYFYQQDGSAFVGIGGAAFSVRAPFGALIVSGIGQQDPNNSAHWTTSITIPPTAPVTQANQYYSITWLLGNGSTSMQSTQYFTVVAAIDTTPTDTGTVVVEGQPFSIVLSVPYPTLQTLSLRITDEKGTVYMAMSLTGSIPTPVQQGANYNYVISVTPSPIAGPTTGLSWTDGFTGTVQGYIAASSNGVTPYIAYFNYTTPTGTQETEFQDIYVVNMLAYKFMNDLRRYVDRIRNQDIIPQLRLTPIDYLHFTLIGMEYLNSIPPSNHAPFLLSNIPPNFYHPLEICATIRLCEAQYLAEGLTEFNFQGAAVQLEVNHPQYWMGLAEALRQEVQSISLAKNHYMRSGGFSGHLGSVGGVWGPVSNIVYRIAPLAMPGAYPVLPFLD